MLPLLYFTQLISRSYELPDVHIHKLSGDVCQEWALPPTPENAVALLMIYYSMNNSGFAWLKSEKKRVVQYAFDAADKPCSRDDAIRIISFALSDKTIKKLGDVYIKKMLQKDKDDPQFHYLKYQAQTMNGFRLPDKQDIDELKRILHLAEKRNDVELAQDLKKKIKALEELLEAEDTPHYDDTFDESDMDQHVDIKLLEKLFEEMHRTLGGHGRRKH